ncbi:thiamine pyrophosphate-binding protein [Paeniglutamicibacter kerguelensis]|uniref:thiamine pyrophosphate-binding protein n=1 Tax=Paeniglutamicibacter kerguelensis TaxID=254788 RepID=UPI00361BE2D2
MSNPNPAATIELPEGVVANNAGLDVMTVLRNYGIDTIFGIPGTHNLEFYRHLAPLGIRPVTSRHEQGAGYGADGWAQQTGLPGVVITTSGPACSTRSPPRAPPTANPAR